MKTKLLRRVAVTLGISVCGFSSVQTAFAQQYGQPYSGYPAPPSLTQGNYSQVPPQGYGQAPQQQYPAQQQQFPAQQQQYPAQQQYQGQPQSNQAVQPGQATPYNQAASNQAPRATLLPPAPQQRPQQSGPQLYDAAPQSNAAPQAVANRWNSFNNNATNTAAPQQNYRTVSTDGSMGVPTPQPVPTPVADSYSTPSGAGNYGAATQPYTPGNSYAPVQGSDCQSCNTGGQYMQAASAPWGGDGYSMIGGGNGSTGSCGVPMAAARPSIYPWFGSFNVLFLDVENNSNKALGIDNAGNRPSLFSSSVTPAASVGFDAGFGRYLGCGKYGLGVNYFHLDPSREESIIAGTAGDMRAAMQSYHDYAIDLGGGGGPDQTYNHVFGTSGDSAGATNIRARRDLAFNGVELNLFSFGLMGAQRAAPLCGDGIGGSGLRHKMASILGSGAGRHAGYGYGGAAGPLVRPANGRVQVMTSHGIRWFRIKDEAQLAYNIDGTAGYQVDDIYDDIDVENNLLGYQFGGRLSYCLSNRLNFNIGGKFGVYGNHVEAERRVGTETLTAYRFGDTNDLADTSYSDTVMSTLGELDLGLGFRVSNAWTIQGGYRVIGVSGIATSFDQMAQDFGTSLNPGSIHANDSLILHGAYVGAAFNW